MSTFTWMPVSAKKKSEPKVSKAKYGDGYEQRVGLGINSLMPEWDLSFGGPLAYVKQVDIFLADQKAVDYFDWRDPDGNLGKFVCDMWEYTPAPGKRSASLTATFRKVPG